MDSRSLDLVESGATLGHLAFSATVLALLLFALAHVVEYAVRRRRFRDALARVSAPAPPRLVPGPAELAGMIEAAPPPLPALTARMRERRVGGIWKEEERSWNARPFVLVVHGSGERLPVVAGDLPRVAARAELRETGDGERVWEACLHHGDVVRIEGELAPAEQYREAGHALVLRAPKGGRLRIEAANAAGDPEDLLLRRRRSAGRLAWIGAALSAGLVTWHAEGRLTSTTQDGGITAVGPCSSFLRGELLDEPCITVATMKEPFSRVGTWLRFEDLPYAPQKGPPPEVGDQVIVTFVGSLPWRHTLGERLAPGPGGTAGLLGGLAWLACFATLRFRREQRWYERE
jgi:hypothetical protein